ncbi:UPF0481 protein At3g47200-like [Manihot esculenta]|uniref:UPF0481 protein At3g47200-like n=1 Tax=Manihot esculenta TaxID=3983 RepID=UPI001CC3B57F|nr:UPF0481 protein At3g47200-like [Manihot esculenta]
MTNEDSVSISINEKLADQSPIFSDHYIFKVSKEQWSVNEEAYEPKLIAIGPYHHGKDHLLAMKDHKIRYLQSLLQQSSQKDVSRYVQIIRNLKERARKYYAEPLSFTHDEFVEMILINGCFIIEFIHKLLEGPLCNSSHVYTPENMIQIKNLLELLHDHWQPFPARLEVYEKMGQAKEGCFTRCATELKDAGIKFKSAVERNNLFDINFVNSTIKIPKIRIGDKTECLLRNLIVYEQLTSSTSPKYFTDYMRFMDCLIDSAKDVELLCCQGIIDNWKGDDESIAILFNKLGEHVFCERALYADIVNNVNEHCKKRSNLWMAKLRHDYFQSPWSFISVLAAIMLLLLSLTQTVYSVLSCYK